MMLYLWLMGRLIRRLTGSYPRRRTSPARAILLGNDGFGVIGLGVRLMFDQMLVGTLAVQFWVVIAIAVLHFHSHRQVDIEGRTACQTVAATFSEVRLPPKGARAKTSRGAMAQPCVKRDGSRSLFESFKKSLAVWAESCLPIELTLVMCIIQYRQDWCGLALRHLHFGSTGDSCALYAESHASRNTARLWCVPHRSLGVWDSSRVVALRLACTISGENLWACVAKYCGDFSPGASNSGLGGIPWSVILGTGFVGRAAVCGGYSTARALVSGVASNCRTDGSSRADLSELGMRGSFSRSATCKMDPSYNYRPVAFVDDAPVKQRAKIPGIPVAGH